MPVDLDLVAEDVTEEAWLELVDRLGVELTPFASTTCVGQTCFNCTGGSDACGCSCATETHEP